MALIAGVAVVSLLLGIGVMQFVVSPAELAARRTPPDAGPVTAEIEQRVIENTVLTRGEVTFADAVKVTLDTAGSENRPIVTGQVPEVGRVFNAGDIALEVGGRPVVVLPGELPAYRSLAAGMRGPDVLQLKAALTSLGYGVGDPASDVFDGDTAAAIGALYEQIGYAAPGGGEESRKAVRDAERATRDAQGALASAQAELAAAIDAAKPDVAAERAAVESARIALEDARETVSAARTAALPTLPSSEVLYLGGLPRRVDEVSVKRGDSLSGSPMTVSGATLAIVGTVSEQDASLLKEGLPARYEGPGGAELVATVQSIEAAKPGGANEGGGDGQGAGGGAGGGTGSGAGGGGQGATKRMTVRLSPGELTPEQVEALRGTNVRLQIPVASTAGEVLAIPIAGLSAGSGGEDRVELVIPDEQAGTSRTESIAVKAGLAADGFVEVSSDDPRLSRGARVVVGR
ncbi:hypothetical protein [Leucobacter luti]|uniref:hypothetical protein n=1 Tax=Leucobacter luti TaxID=340320 RepID=UPI003D03E19E